MLSEFNLYQLLIPIFGILMIGRTYSQWRRKKRTVREMIVVFLFWGIASAFSLFPDYFLARITLLTGVKNGFHAIIFFFIFLFLYSIFSLFIKIEHLEQDITTIVRKDAIERFKRSEEN